MNEILEAKSLIVPMVTPMFIEGETYALDEQVVISLVNNLANAGVDVIFVGGNAGCFQFLTPEQKSTLMTLAVEHKGNARVFAGISSENPDEILELAAYAENAQLDGFVVLPFFPDLSEGEALTRLMKLAEATTTPIYLYNNPFICNDHGLSLDFVRQVIEKIPGRIAGIKESSGNLELFYELLELRQSGIDVYLGDASKLTQIPIEMFDGAVPVHANVEPDTYRRYLNGEVDLRFKLEEYIERFPTIPHTILEMVSLRMVDEATISFWNIHHT
jgi:dihydrodipicolinate synthase/N-acetylneuraminate lyase